MFSPFQYYCPAVEAARPENYWQVIIVAVLWLGVRQLMKAREAVARETDVEDKRYCPRIWLARNATLPVLAVVLVIIATAFELSGISVPVLRLGATLFSLWTLIGIATAFIPDRFWAESTAVVFFAITTFAMLTVDDELIDFLDSLQLPISAGGTSLSVWKLFTVATSLGIAIWIGLGLSKFLERRVQSLDRISGSTRALIEKVIRVIFIIFAMVVGLTSVGINLSALTVFGGAFALGLGFGLQKIVSNLISGFILLSDSSIKPGDVIELDDTYGWINTLRARYVSVITRDGTEHLIPNEDLITQKVVNWSFTHDRVRLKAPIGIAYKEDPHRVIKICIEAASTHPRVLEDPAPACLLKGFGDSSVDLELRFWIRDPHKGVSNVRSAVLLEVWDRFQAEGIEIPYPQHDLHIKTATPLTPEKND
ncbi:mechanosensitive ion channel family protein [Rubellicoccus peritrichatus]|uniref:Mechanosensitive ion channel n=1 Tax=Rubellicoccus peritrichatus TaxID=3080537 RepID=A0AAQ3LGN4_9BACT|nr:mechanosensitive ion channel domain-containing protein [Puniceicoccus sp. CR14]WOO43540.1 mechanosensitive ion channel [Puniceicoccus sp. CR14]